MDSVSDAWLNRFEIATRSLFEAFASECSSEKSIEDAFMEHFTWTYSEHDLIIDLIYDVELFAVLKTIGEILQVKFTYLHIENDIQQMKETNLYEIFIELSKHNIHNTDICKCEFHRESVFAHLIMAMLIAIKIQDTYENKLLNGFIALMHDIGKKGTQSAIKNYTTFYFHGEMGSGMMQLAWTDAYVKFFSREQWENMARTIAIHMCGYNDRDTDIEQKYKHNMIRLENPEVKHMWTQLSYADGNAKIGHGHSTAQDNRLILAGQISTEYIPLDKKCMLIQLQGMSGSGKSTMSKRLQKVLQENNISFGIVERDAVIRKVIHQEKSHISEDASYGEVYGIYNSNKKEYAIRVNQIMESMIGQMSESKQVIIVDTVYTLFSDFKINNKIFIMSLFVIRNELFEGDNVEHPHHDFDTQTEIKLHNTQTFFSWLPNECIRRLQALTSLSTANTIARASQQRPLLCHIVTWQNNEKLLGFLEAIRQINIIVPTLSNANEKHTNTNTMGIVEYVNYLYENNGIDKMIEIIKEQRYMVKQPMPNVIMIKYLEHNSDLSPKWAREARGTILYLETKWILLKYQLQRGIEILTSVHKTKNITETENSKYQLALEQIETTRLINERENFESVLTFKVDGSLLSITLYSGGYYSLGIKLVTESNNQFARCVMELAQQMKMPFIPIISTQGTLFLGNEMLEYMIIAILSDTYSDEIYKMETPIGAFSKYGEAFINALAMIHTYFNKIENTTIMTITMEAVCKNRLSSWTTRESKDLHTELAISYNYSGIRVLGVSIGTTCYPHFVFSDVIAEAKLKEPLYWQMNNTNTIEEMINDLSILIRNPERANTEQMFLQKYKPSNKYMPEHPVFDWEGFVLYRLIKDNGKITYDYNKIKTIEYYTCHKFRESNIETLLEIGKVAGDIFPLARATISYFRDNKNNVDKLVATMNAILVNNEKEYEDLYKALYDALPEKAKGAFTNKSNEIKIKMLINCNAEIWNNVSHKLVKEIFPNMEIIAALKEEIGWTLKKTIMDKTDNEYTELKMKLFKCVILSIE